MTRFHGGHNECVKYAVSVARAALGMDPEVPEERIQSGLHPDEITELIGYWFPNHRVHIWSGDDLSKNVKSDNVTYEGDELHHDDYPPSDYLFMYVYTTEPDYAHMVVGLIENAGTKIVMGIAIETEPTLQISDIC